MAKLTEQQVVDLVTGEFENSMGAKSGDLTRQRAALLDFYNRKGIGNEDDSISKVVTSDVMEVVDGIMPPLMRMFTTQDNLLSFDATGPEDEAGAEQESDYVSHTFFKRNPAFQIMFFWVFDAILLKNGYVKAYWDDSEEVSTESYKGLTDDELGELLSDDELSVIEHEEFTETITGEDLQSLQVQVHDVKLKRVTKTGYARVVNVPPDEFRISRDANSLDCGDARMTGHERYTTRSELLEMGFDKAIVAALPAEAVSITAADTHARKDNSDDRAQAGKESDDKSQDKMLLREAYIKVDMDGDGIAELKQVYTANGKMLQIEDADRQIFHSLSSSPLPHKHVGSSPAEKVMDTQLITTTLLRQILENLYHTNNPGHVLWEQAIGDTTMDDLLTRKVGSVVTVDRPVGESLGALAVPFTAEKSFPMLEYFDKVKRDRTGVQSDSESLKPDALKHIQQSVMMQSLDTSKAKIELIARIFAETGFKSLFRHLHELLQKHQDKEEVVKLRGDWVPVKPQEWRTRRNMTVHIGLGIGTREQNLLHLESVAEKQAQMATGGLMGLTVTPKNIYNTAKEFVKNANLKEPEMFFTDPGDQQAPPPSSQQEELQKKEQELQQRQQQLDAERQQVKAQELQLKAQKQQIDAQLKMQEIQSKADEREDKSQNEIGKLRNEISALQLQKEADDADRALEAALIPGKRDLLQGQAMKVRAETGKIVGETEAVDIENAATESGITKLAKDIGQPAESK